MPKIIKNLRDDILNESMEIINKEGIDNLSIRHISSKLGIAPSTIYNYYQGKEQIIGALTKRHWDKALKKIDRALEENKSIVHQLDMIVEELRASVKPLLLFHVSSAHKMDLALANNFDHQKRIFNQLQLRVKRILEKERKYSEDMESMSSIITKLIVTCLHDDELNFEVLTQTIKKL